MALDYGIIAAAVSLEIEQDDELWPVAYRRLREAVLAKIHNDGGMLCEGPAYRVEHGAGVVYTWPAVRP